MSNYPPGVNDADERFNDTETNMSYDARLRKAQARRHDIEATRLDALIRQQYWLIWCHARGMWWKSGEYGYTSNRAEAGLYSYGDAFRIVTKANIVVKDKPEESMIPATEEDLKRLV